MRQDGGARRVRASGPVQVDVFLCLTVALVVVLAGACSTSEPIEEVLEDLPSDPLAWVPPELADSVERVELARDRFGDPACTSGDALTLAWEQLAAALDRLASDWESLGAEPSAAGRAWLEGVAVDAVLADCPGVELDHDSARAHTQRLAGAIDRVALTAMDVGDGLWTPIWTGDVFGVHREVATGSTFDVVILGTSAARRGLDPDQLGRELDASVANAGVAGALIEVQSTWAREVLDLAPDVRRVVWAVSAVDLFAPCRSLGAVEADGRLGRRFRFEGFPSVTRPEARTAFPLLFGADYGNQTQLDRGDPALDSVEEDAANLQFAFQGPGFRTADPCPHRRRVVSELVADMVDERGLEVAVVALPTADRLTAEHPDGTGGVRLAIEQLLVEATDAGAETFDLSGLPQELMIDLTHLGREGRGRATADLADHLRG